MQKELVEQFIQKYKHKPTHAFFCPGRINLIGEHIDYHGGKVFGTWVYFLL